MSTEEDNLNTETLNEFPCLRHAHVFAEGDETDDETYGCIAPDEHEGPHDFVPSSSLMFKLRDEEEIQEVEH